MDYTNLVDAIQASDRLILIFNDPRVYVQYMHSRTANLEWDRASPSHAVWDHYYPNFTRRQR